MRRSTPAALLVAIVVLLAVGVTTAAVRETRDDEGVDTPTVAAPAPLPGGRTAQPSTAPTTAAPPQTAVPPTPTTAAPAPAPTPTTVAAPSATRVGPAPAPGTEIPNTGGGTPLALGLLLIVLGLLGWRLSGPRLPMR